MDARRHIMPHSVVRVRKIDTVGVRIRLLFLLKQFDDIVPRIQLPLVLQTAFVAWVTDPFEQLLQFVWDIGP